MLQVKTAFARVGAIRQMSKRLMSPVSPKPSDCATDEVLRQHFRYPAGILNVRLTEAPRTVGFFRFGSATCFGSSNLSGVASDTYLAGKVLPSATAALGPGTVYLPFDPGEIAANHRFERYATGFAGQPRKQQNSNRLSQAYYLARKLIPTSVRRQMHRLHFAGWHRIPFPSWPVDCSVELMFEHMLGLALQAQTGTEIPFVWFWPDGHASCLIMTHDVEEAAGLEFCSQLMDLDEKAGMRSSFQIIPEERYHIPPSLLSEIRDRGHEVNIHDLRHDGLLFRDRKEFRRRAEKIRMYAQVLHAEGFRSGGLYRNLEWYEELDFAYDMSVPSVGHLDPQRGGCCTSMPYFKGRVLELPLTTTQDYSLFHVLQDYSLDLWEEQIQAILARHGLISFDVHPDYVIEERARSVYEDLLSRLLSLRSECNMWAALPRDLNRWWRQRSEMELEWSGTSWRIVGEGSDRARVAYASLDGDQLVYRLEA